MNQHNKIFRIIILAFSAGIIYVGKIMFQGIPNFEFVTFFLMIFTLTYTLKEALWISTVYTIVEILLWGWTEQFYIWTIIVLITFLLKNIFKENFILWSLLSAFFGISFGFLSSIPILILTNLQTATSYWIAGIYFDIGHMICNYFIMLLLGQVIYKKLQILIKEYFR